MMLKTAATRRRILQDARDKDGAAARTCDEGSCDGGEEQLEVHSLRFRADADDDENEGDDAADEADHHHRLGGSEPSYNKIRQKEAFTYMYMYMYNDATNLACQCQWPDHTQMCHHHGNNTSTIPDLQN